LALPPTVSGHGFLVAPLAWIYGPSDHGFPWVGQLDSLVRLVWTFDIWNMPVALHVYSRFLGLVPTTTAIPFYYWILHTHILDLLVWILPWLVPTPFSSWFSSCLLVPHWIWIGWF